MNVRPLSKELQEKANNELNERPDRIKDDIQHIKDWISKQPHLRARTEDQWIVAFLRGCKYSLEKVKTKIDLFYSLKTHLPEWQKFNLNEQKYMDILETGVYFPLPDVNPITGARVLMIRSGTYDADKVTVDELFSLVCAVQLMMFYSDDEMIVSGSEVILDLDNVSMAHYLQMTPAVMKKLVVATQDASPARQKGAHYLNTPPGFEVIFNFVKTLLSEKNRSRLHVHNKDYESLYQKVPREILPEEYGGNAGSIKTIVGNLKKELEANAKLFEEEKQYGTDEKKRMGPTKSAHTLFGVDGSFRQLSFD